MPPAAPAIALPAIGNPVTPNAVPAAPYFSTSSKSSPAIPAAKPNVAPTAAFPANLAAPTAPFPIVPTAPLIVLRTGFGKFLISGALLITLSASFPGALGKFLINLDVPVIALPTFVSPILIS